MKVTAIALLAFFAVPLSGAMASSFAGRTSQRQRISFTLNGARIVHLGVTVSATCEDGITERHTVSLGSGRLSHGQFTVVGGSGAIHYVVQGTIHGRRAAGHLRVFLLFALTGRLSATGSIFCDTGTPPHAVSFHAAGAGKRVHGVREPPSPTPIAHAATAVAYNQAGNCINYGVSGYHDVGDAPSPPDHFRLMGPEDRSSDTLGEGLRAPLASFVSRYRRLFADAGGQGSVLAPHEARGGVLPFDSFIVPWGELPMDDGGITATLCENPAFEGIVLASDYLLRGFSSLPYILAHELAHAFQSGAIGRTTYDNWFLEASAEYFGLQLAPDPVLTLQRDSAFFSRPDIALDTFNRDGDESAHEYGAFRFIQWLAQHVPDAAALFLSVVRSTGTTHLGSDSVTQALADKLATHGQSFANDLGEFWADHMLEPADQPFGGTGPRVDGTPTTAGGADILHPDRLSAVFATYTLPAGTRQVTFTAPPSGPDGRFWVLIGGRPRDWSAGANQTFCVGDPSPGALPWTGELPVVYVNTSIVGDSSLRLQTDTSTEPCRPRDPATPTPYQALGSCPPTPLPPVGRGQNGDWRFLYQVDKVFEDMNTWGDAAYFDASGVQRGLTDGLRRYRLVLLCTAQRAAGMPSQNPAVIQARSLFVYALNRQAHDVTLLLSTSGSRHAAAGADSVRQAERVVGEWTAMMGLTSGSGCDEWRRVNDSIGCGAITNP